MPEDKSAGRLWTPWRMEYILGEKPQGCIFCVKPGEDRDRSNLILARRTNVFIIMNKYPYNNGHIMVTPYTHCSDMASLSAETLSELMSEVNRSVSIIRELMNPDGFNIGMNIGKAGGAGIDEHLHMHIVPRWNGDTNFMPVMADTRVMPEYLDDTYMKLHPLFQRP